MNDGTVHRRRWDAVIVGSGAGGGALALRLSQAGLRVLVLEKGRALERRDFSDDEVDALWSGLFLPPLADDPHVLVHAGLAAPRPSHLGWTASCVGGGTVHMGGYFSRFLPEDFRLRSLLGPVDQIADWPYSYDDLEPYYSQAEWEMGVSGAAGSNPFEGPRSRPYPMPPLADHPLAGLLDRAAAGLGWSPYPTPRAINSKPYQGRPACSYCAACAGYGCRTGARGSSLEALIGRAVATGRCTVVPQAMVCRVLLAPDGRASGCLYIDRHGAMHRAEARIVCLACSAVETARLLLLSASPAHPDGLANGSGLVGRHLQFHGTSTGIGRFTARPEAGASREAGGEPESANPFLGRSLMDHYFLGPRFGEAPKGGLMLFHRPGASPILRAKMIAQQGAETLWGEALSAALPRRPETEAVTFEVHHDFHPTLGTFASLDPDVEDRWGLPAARIHLEDRDERRQIGQRLVDKGLELLDAMGAESVAPGQIGLTAPYLVHGTCRAGRDPASSVLDPFCRAHEIPNLFVADGSFMPTSGGAPPTLTIVANALRTADRILELGRIGELG